MKPCRSYNAILNEAVLQTTSRTLLTTFFILFVPSCMLLGRVQDALEHSAAMASRSAEVTKVLSAEALPDLRTFLFGSHAAAATATGGADEAIAAGGAAAAAATAAAPAASSSSAPSSSSSVPENDALASATSSASFDESLAKASALIDDADALLMKAAGLFPER